MIRRRRLRWAAGVLVVALLILGVLVVFHRAGQSRTSDSPRSPGRFGTAALATLLQQEGVRITVHDDVDEALRRTDATTTLLVVGPHRLSPGQAQALRGAAHGRLVLLRPNEEALSRFGLPVTTRSWAGGLQLRPGCAEPVARLADTITPGWTQWSYRPTAGSELACYAIEDSFAYVRVDGVDIVSGGITNTELGVDGNAAFAMNVLGSQPSLIWLMTPEPAAAPEVAPLPPWWSIGAIQAAVAFLVVAVWRGRRFGPIIVEPLPVTVRAAETVVGHGRLYHRLEARDRAAAALRAGLRARLGRAYGHSEDPVALSAAVAARTGLDAPAVRALLDGPPPTTDDQLAQLARDLDRLEQEARQL